MTLVAKDGRKQRVLIVYDSLSGCTLATNVDNSFNWGLPGKETEIFSLSTVNGNDNYAFPVVEYMILKLQKLSDHFVKNRMSSLAIPRIANGQDYMSRLMVLSLCFVAYGALL